MKPGIGRLKGEKRTAFAVISPDGFVCKNLIRATKFGCIKAHEKMFPEYPWYYYEASGFSIKPVKVKEVKE